MAGRSRALVEALAAVAPRCSPRDRTKKLRLLERLSGCAIGQPGQLLRLHEALCFLQAYPDDRQVLRLADRALEAFPARVRRLGPSALARLHDSGIAGTTLDYPFGFPFARWLVSRFPEDVEVAWTKYEEGERLEEALGLVVARAEEDAFSEGGLGWRRWLRAARGGRRLTDLQILLEQFEQAALPQETRDWLFERLELPILWRLRGQGASRTFARLPWPRPFYHRAGLRRSGLDLVREVERPLPPPRRAPRPLADSIIEAARLALATRLRELHAFAHPNPEDVLLVEPGRGLRIALIGILPEFRLPIDGYYPFFALKNGVPVGYGGGWGLFGALEFGFNIFPSFRQGESAFILSQVLRVYRQALGIRTVVVDPAQIGRDNPEALRSGAFYFYHRLGFRPRDPAVICLCEEEQEKIARDPSYRSPIPILRRLADGEIYLTLPGGSPQPERRLRASRVAALVTRHIIREFGGDRAAALRDASARVAKGLGVPSWRAWPPDERRAFEQLSVVAALIPDLARWPAADRRGLARIFRAKGARSELPYIGLLEGHRRFRSSLEALAAASPAP
ncbi:MAG TPA: hypothetical protein VIG69_06785 [Candidatus Methylomirabilis sp.]|jgi:hypothetical protein